MNGAVELLHDISSKFADLHYDELSDTEKRVADMLIKHDYIYLKGGVLHCHNPFGV